MILFIKKPLNEWSLYHILYLSVLEEDDYHATVKMT